MNDCKGITHLSENYAFFSTADDIEANSMEPDQARQTVEPDLDPNCLTLLTIFLKEYLKKIILKKKNQPMTKRHAKLPSMERVKQACINSLAVR